MFDAETIALIRAAPELDGLDLEALPRVLTAAYAKIVAARIRLRESAAKIESHDVIEDVIDTVAMMRRLAYVQEALISLSPERHDRASGAFVAGAAHHVVVQASRMTRGEDAYTRLKMDGISAEVSAALLFLISESHADAAEMAMAFRLQIENDSVEHALLRAIRNLALGRLDLIVSEAEPDASTILLSPLAERGAHALYLMLLRGVNFLASNILGADEHDPSQVFLQVITLSTKRILGIGDGDSGAAFSVYPGPNHLASLLLAVARDLPASALAALPAPTGLDGARWSMKMSEISRRRPFLWRNHRAALARGYLELGVSSVVSFPTGAGKSTLSELKIAATLLAGKKVVFLAPTLALVDQTARALKLLFPQDELQRERSTESPFDFTDGGLPAISVMTPERCLALLGFDAGSFSDVGLLVFDECHLLHPRDSDRSRRALDSMLCVLSFTHAAPKAELLLMSAMMSNAERLAEWIAELTSRTCLALNLTWKPTRQVRGCVVYAETDVTALKDRLRDVRAKVTNVHAPLATQREMQILPYGFICLHQTWQSNQREDYALLPILDDKVTLAVATSYSNDWYLTPNGVKVASAIAIGAGSSTTTENPLKTLIFTQTIPLAKSAAAFVSQKLKGSGSVLTTDEQRLYEACLDEMGESRFLYIEVDSNYSLSSSSLPHHGLLLPNERNLHESLYKRPDGISVLVATSTLAQGMNLPSQVVIIASDSRFDPDAKQMEKIEAHELLNAAGRAGRAGESSYGFVLVVPSKVMHFNDQSNTIHGHWSELRSIFSQSDQCLAIEDPVAPILDQIHLHSDFLSESARYFLRRLPITFNSLNPDDAAISLLNRSMGAYFKRQQNDHQWIASRIASALKARHLDPDAPLQPDWADRLASSAGLTGAVIRAIATRLATTPPPGNGTIDWREWVWDWLNSAPDLVPQLLRRESLENLLGRTYRALEDDLSRGNSALPILRQLLASWMEGKNLSDIERAYGTREEKLGKCENAREFVLRIVPELAYIFALPEQVILALRKEAGSEELSQAACSSLGACVREGFDSVEKLALYHLERGSLWRRATHRASDEMEWAVLSPVHPEDWHAAIARVRSTRLMLRALN